VEFRTRVAALPPQTTIDHNSPILLLGSCFSDHIGQRLTQNKFNVVLNPFGILYHPLSILHGLERLSSGRLFTTEDLHRFEDRIVSFWHHGKYKDRDPEAALNRINHDFEMGKDQLENGKALFITWGSAFGFTHPEFDGKIVSNCHKIPAKEFKQCFTETEELVQLYSNWLRDTIANNPKIEIYFTVSPVKHLRNGLVDNSLSKATLIVAARKLAKRFTRVQYFPAYELLVDELRDYRFYAKDMAHPSDQAVEYIWEYFSNTFFAEGTQKINFELENLTQALQHRFLHSNPQQTHQFASGYLKKIDKLKKALPGKSFQQEYDYFMQLLQSH
jgi:hypothetical protein